MAQAFVGDVGYNSEPLLLRPLLVLASRSNRSKSSQSPSAHMCCRIQDRSEASNFLRSFVVLIDLKRVFTASNFSTDALNSSNDTTPSRLSSWYRSASSAIHCAFSAASSASNSFRSREGGT